MDGSPVKAPEAEPPPAPPAPTLAQQAPSARLVLALAMPVLVQQLLTLSVTLSDRFLAGRFQPGDPEQHIAFQSAQNTALYLAWFVVNFTVLVTVGSTALVARFVGAGDRGLAVRTMHQSLLLALGLGLTGTVLGWTLLEWALTALQLRGEAVGFAAAYLRPLLLLLVFQVTQSAGIACLVGAGDTRTGMYVLGSVALLNVPLAWLFFHGLGPVPRLGFPGIAWGTALSNLIGCTLVVAVLLHGRAGLRLRLRMLQPDFRLIYRLLRVSVPAAADSLSASLGQLWFLSIINRLGDTAGSAHGIALTWEALAYLSGAAFGTAAMTLVGQNLGAGQPTQARHSGWLAFGLGCAIMTGMGLVFFLLAPEMFLLFCPNPEQREVIAIGVPVLRLVAFAMPALASCIVFTGALRGAGDTRMPVLYTLSGFFLVRIPLAYWMTLEQIHLGVFGTWSGLGWGLYGAWVAMFADLLVRGALLGFRFTSGRWQRMRV